MLLLLLEIITLCDVTQGAATSFKTLALWPLSKKTKQKNSSFFLGT